MKTVRYITELGYLIRLIVFISHGYQIVPYFESFLTNALSDVLAVTVRGVLPESCGKFAVAVLSCPCQESHESQLSMSVLLPKRSASPG